jgi:Lrp/AsnC family leucine-responsive transcriptional regulator
MKNSPTPFMLDSFDQKILDIVQVNNLRPHREIARIVGLSIPAVGKRLKRLREAGVIIGDISVLNQEEVGSPITIIAQVSVESEAREQLDAIQKRFLECPRVQQCYYVTGDADFILILTVRNMGEYVALTRSLFFDSRNVKQFRTFVSMDRVKVSLRVPIERS